MYTQRTYNGLTDQTIMQQLALEYFTHQLHSIDLPYRFSSPALEDTHNAALWMDEQGNLAGWAVMQLPFWTVDIACRPDAVPQLYPLILQWAAQRGAELNAEGAEREAWFIPVFENQQEFICILEEYGWVSQADVAVDPWSKVWMQHAGVQAVPSTPAPVGYTVRPLRCDTEIDEYVDLHRSVFETKNMNLAWRRRILDHPACQPQLNLMVENPGGELCGFFIGWLEQVDGNLFGQVEPMGISPAFQGAGLGRALLSEGLKRMYELGAGSVYVETDYFRGPALALYERCGFVIRRKLPVFRKDFPLP